jgi:hypothetical protein
MPPGLNQQVRPAADGRFQFEAADHVDPLIVDRWTGMSARRSVFIYYISKYLFL